MHRQTEMMRIFPGAALVFLLALASTATLAGAAGTNRITVDNPATGAVQFSVDSTGNVTGGSLTVTDSGGNTKAVVQNTGSIGVGTTSGTLGPTADIQVVEEGLVNPTVIIDGASDNSTTKPSFQFMRARGSHAALAAIQNNDWLGQFQLNGYNGSAYDGARKVFQVEASEDWTPTNGGYRFVFYTRQNGTVGPPTARVTIDNTGYVGIGTTTPAQALEVNGAVRINTTATQPACSATTRGSFWVTQDASNMNDVAQVCVISGGSYTWKSLF
jgi:hypothetical protein